LLEDVGGVLGEHDAFLNLKMELKTYRVVLLVHPKGFSETRNAADET